MAKFVGKIGYVINNETEPGVWTDVVTEKDAYGDLLKDRARWQSTGQVNDTLNIISKVSIVADDFSLENVGNMRYVIMNNTKWSISNIENIRPRLVMTLGGVYNGK